MRWIRFALKNARRNRRRSLVTVAITAIGTLAILLAGGFALYTYESLAQASARMTGHLILGTPDQFFSEEEQPLQHGIDDWKAVASSLLGDADVRAILPSVSFSGLASNGEKSTVMVALGVDPKAEFTIKGPFLKMIDGSVLTGDSGGAEVMLGEGLARSLKAKPGASLTLLASTSDGAMNALDVIVRGVFSTGVTEVDKRILYVDLVTSQRLLHSERVSALGVFLSRIDKTADAQARLGALQPALVTRSWEDEATFYQSVKALYNRIFGALGIVIALIVVAVVTNAMAMSIVERTREIATLRAIGTFPRQLIWCLTWEGLLLGLAGVMSGGVLAFGVSMLLYVFPVQMPPPPGRSTSYPLNISVDGWLYLGTAFLMVALAVVASALVARRTVNLPISAGLAHT
ncbi:FtsX-like permease family protein [Variovorax sp. J22P271]|uniref:FtsX-like permease family protein n=1 Tax=Variovorax davisae TaxID=3053515 RepID=UPI00257754D5|nr:FtsX-like permease family protein [Variovorax sp. J22P271]MDM0034334.1 FtsX-like permease family protein [Variovorax sp. J22P271]